MSSKEEPKIVKKYDDAPSIEEYVSDDEEEDVDCNYHQKLFQRMVKPLWNNAQRVNHQNFAKKTHPCAKKNLVPKAVLMKSGLVSINTARQNISKTAVLVNTARQVNATHSKTIVNAARPMSYLSKIAHSTINRPIHKNTTFKNSNINQRVNTVRGKKFNTARLKAIVNAVKASACWVWKPKHKVLDHVSKHNSASIILKKFDYIDAQGNMSYLTDYEEIDGGYVCFGGNPKGGKITRKVPRKNNMYSIDLKNIVPNGGLTYLFAKATSDESKLWHRRLGHLNFKTMNKLVKGNIVRGLPSKLFENDQTCCLSKEKAAQSLFRFTWVFFLATKDETSGILKSFITRIENLVDHKVKVIRCDNGTEFKNREMNKFCEMKGILRQFSVARTPQQNRVAERRNRTLIEAARTMLADSKLSTTFWAEVVNTACYVQNRVLVVKPHNKTPYELFNGRTPTLSFLRPFGCPVTILNTIDHLGKFDGKADEGFFVGYSMNSKAFRVFNSKTRIVEENLHIRISESTPNVVDNGPDWLFDIDALTSGEYEMWKLRIEQYFQVQDYALWDVIENGNSFVPAIQSAAEAAGSSTTISKPVTAEDKLKKKNDVKARSLLLMALPNEHQLTFNQYKDAKTLFAAIEARFGGNEVTKKTQKTLLKQMYENFSASRAESLDSIFNRLQKLRNKPDLDTMSFDNLYNNFKIVKQEVKGTATSSSNSQNVAFVSTTSPNITNELNTAYRISTASTQVSTASSQVSTANLSDATVYAFLANQPNGSQLVHEDLKTTSLSGYDKSKVECFNCHKLGHFARECRGPKNQDSMNKNQDNSRRTVNVEETPSKAMLAIDGAGCQIVDKSKKGLGYESYHAVPPPPIGEVNEPKENSNVSLVEEQMLDDLEKKTVSPTASKVNCDYHQRERVVSRNNYSRVNNYNSTKKVHPSAHRNMAPRVVLMKIGLKAVNTVRHVNTAHPKTTVHSARPMSCFTYKAPSTVRRPIQKKTTLTNNNSHQKVNIVKGKLNTARPKVVNTAKLTSAVINAVRANQVNDIKALACWVWRPTKLNNASITFKRQNYIDARGRSKHMTGNMSYLSEFKEFNEGYVTFGGRANRGKITGKGTLKIGKLDFKDVYFVMEED
ncbi:putative ribonuclease H-like domain-containing protein [Tanacetum coccineum]